MRAHRSVAGVSAVLALGLTATLPGEAQADAGAARRPAAAHVLLVSVDGLHQQDLTWYVSHHPQSTLARLAGTGLAYRHASTPFPSDSFPGMLAQLTGGDPKTTGVYYDDSYNRTLLPAGTTACAGVAAGAEVDYAEPADRDPSRLDAGQGLTGLPGSILSLTGSPETLLNPGALPVDPKTCTPVYPHQYVKVNTVFNVGALPMSRSPSDQYWAHGSAPGLRRRPVRDVIVFEPPWCVVRIAPGSAVAGTDGRQQDGEQTRLAITRSPAGTRQDRTRDAHRLRRSQTQLQRRHQG